MSISEKRLEELASHDDSEIDYSDIPELDQLSWRSCQLIDATPLSARGKEDN